MQIQSFYLDLREGPQYAKKERNVWLLESEAFKEPLKFSFSFDQKDKNELTQIQKNCEEVLWQVVQKEKEIQKRQEELEWFFQKIKDQYKYLEDLNQKYSELLDGIKRREELLIKQQKKENENLISISGEIARINDILQQPKKALVKKFNSEDFVMWTEKCYGNTISVDPWKYLIIESRKYFPQNEYVANYDEFNIKEEFIDGEYIPVYQLLSTNAIDTPVAKIELCVLFFQI